MRIESTTTIAVTAAPPKMIEVCVIVKPPSSAHKVCMECIEKQLSEYVPGISGDVEGVGSTVDTAVVVGGVNVVMLLLAVAIDAVTLLLILLLGGKVVVISAVLPILLGGKVVIVGAALSTLMLVLGTVVVLVAAVLSTVEGEMVVVIAAKLTLVLTGKTTQVMVFTDVSLPRMVVSV